MNRRFLLSLLPVSLFAQTRVRLGQIKAKAAGIIVSMTDGSVQSATIGPGLSISASTPPVISAVSSGLVQVWGTPVAKQVSGVYTLIRPVITPATVDGFRLFRNGLYQVQGVDYTIDASFNISPPAGVTWEFDDTLHADYQHS